MDRAKSVAIDALLAENKQLKKRLEAAERDNRELKLSVYDLSARLSAALSRNGGRAGGADQHFGGAGGADHAIHNGLPTAEAVEQLSRAAMDDVVHSTSSEPLGAGLDAGGAQTDGRHLAPLCTLNGHNGAVYAVNFSPNGRLLASGSFDKSVRCWLIDDGDPCETLCLQKHSHNVSTLSWAADSRQLLSGSYDHTVRLWDVEAALPTPTRTWHVPNAAFVQSVAFEPTLGCSLFAAATTRSEIALFDVRQPDERPVAELKNEAMVNAVLFLPSANHLLSGDKHGALRAWDLRNRSCVSASYAGDARKPISHVTLSPPISHPSSGRGGGGGGGGGSLAALLAEPRFLGVNSYDDTLRVYSKGYAPWEALAHPRALVTSSPGSPTPAAADGRSSRDSGERGAEERVSSKTSSSHASPSSDRTGSATGGGSLHADDPNNSNGGGGGGSLVDATDADSHLAYQESEYAECIHALVGHRSRAYPIRSSIHVGADYTPPRSGGTGAARRSAVVDTYSGADDARPGRGGSVVTGGLFADAPSQPTPTVHTSALIATGSVDGDAYLYDISGPNGSGELLQRLRGHTDRVYAVEFHPSEPLLASASADFSIRLWAPERKQARRYAPRPVRGRTGASPRPSISERGGRGDA